MTLPAPPPARPRPTPRWAFALVVALLAAFGATTPALAAPAPTAAAVAPSPQPPSTPTVPERSAAAEAPTSTDAPAAPAPAPRTTESKLAADAATVPTHTTNTTATIDMSANTVTAHPAPSGDTPDPRADIVQYGANYGTNTVVVAIQTAIYTPSGFDALWDIDVNGDGVVDYDVFYPSGNIRRDADFLLLCGGTPLVNPSANTYLVSFPSQCLGDPPSFRTRSFSQFGDSVDFAPHDNISWSQWVARGNPPIGNLDNPTSSSGAIRVTGWGIDPDVNGPISVAVTIDGVGGWLLANLARPDVGSAYPAFGPNHGFELNVSATGGLHQVCASAINDYGGPTSLGCKLIAVPAAEPIGRLDSVSAGPGQVTVGGWTLDPNTPNPLAVHVYADGKQVAVITADANRPDIGAAYPGYGNNHGFNQVVVLAPGAHTVCAYAINVGPGTANTTLGCRSVQVGGNPIGSLDNVTAGPGDMRVRGWAIDPDTAASIPVHVYLDGAMVVSFGAALARGDIGSAFPDYGPNHGFEVTYGTVAPGAHQVCAYAINTGSGTVNPLLGCRSVTVGGNPFGSLDGATVDPARLLSVRGWAIDPDVKAAINVHIYIDGTQASIVAAGSTREDIGNAFPAFGSGHGFAATLGNPLTPGTHTICAYAINVGSGTTNTTLGCRTIIA